MPTKKSKLATRISVGSKSKPVVKRFDAWSFSRWRDYENCPRQAKYKYLDKLPEGPEGDALKRGSAVHSDAETYLKLPKPQWRFKRVWPSDPPDANGKRTPTLIAAALQPMAEDFERLRKAGALSELQLAFDNKWRPTGYFDPNVWVRIKIDALLLPAATRAAAEVIDFKTGRYRPEDRMNELQLDLYGTSILSAYTKRSRVKAELWYTDSAKPVAAPVVTQDHALKMRNDWNARVEPMFEDKRFVPKANPGCKWCAFAKSKGGPCDLG